MGFRIEYVLGKSVILETDHKPLVPILGRKFRSAPTTSASVQTSFDEVPVFHSARTWKDSVYS